MFNFTDWKITAANAGGYLIRPKTGYSMVLVVNRPSMTCILKAGIHRLSTINVDIFNDKITFMDHEGLFIATVSGSEGTQMIQDYLKTGELNDD